MGKNSKSSPKLTRLLLTALVIVAILAVSYLLNGGNPFVPGGNTDGQASSLSDFVVVDASDAATTGQTQSASAGTTLRTTAASSRSKSSRTTATTETTAKKTAATIAEDGIYTHKNDVALYIYTYHKLPSNFIKKADAEKLGWSGGGLDKYAKNKCIGGDRFGNYEGVLPKKQGRTYTECDIDTLGAKSRGAKRIVFSNDWLIYYTEDHYDTFELLYGQE